MKRTFKKGDLAILIHVYTLCLEYDMERYIETASWHEDLCMVTEVKNKHGAANAYKILTVAGNIEYANALFLFDPSEYEQSTYEELYNTAMEERYMNERVRWRKHSKIENERDNGQVTDGGARND